MALPLVYGSVAVDDDGVATFTPSDPLLSAAGRIYTGELQAIQLYTAANDGEVPPDAERVKLLQYYATRSNCIAQQLVEFLNIALA